MESKSIIITGCSSGFGRHLLDEFCEKGFRVFGLSRNIGFLSESQLKSSKYKNLKLIKIDLTDESTIGSAAFGLKKELTGKLDILVNNAGFGLFGIFESIPLSEFKREFDVNFFGHLSLTQKLLPELRAVKGRIINVSSLAGFHAPPLLSAYSSSKFALEGATESLFHELKPHGVQVGLIRPGGFRTGFAENQTFIAKEIDDPIYTVQLRSFREFQKNLRKHRSGSPRPVINAIVKMASAKKMPLRVEVGADSKGLYFLSRILPRSLFFYLTGVFFHRKLLTR